MNTSGRTGKATQKWLKVMVKCGQTLIDPLSDLLGRLSGTGVEIRPTEPEAEIIAYFQVEQDADGTENSAALNAQQNDLKKEIEKLAQLLDQQINAPRFELMAEEDWSETWKRFFKPFAIVPGLIIKPSWEQYEAKPGERIMELDPGMAFGTGQHASTQMALTLIQYAFTQREPLIKNVADVGTGTGILAMAAALFGAREIIAVDNDPEAVDAARDNVAANRLERVVTVDGTDVAKLEGPFELICANIVHDVLVEMAPIFKQLIAPGGKVVLAGILHGDQEKNIVKVYGNLGMSLTRAEHQDEWASLLLTA